MHVCITHLWVEHGSADLFPCLDVNTHQTGRPWWDRRWSLQRSQTAQLRASPPLWPIYSSKTCLWLVLQNRTKHLITIQVLQPIMSKTILRYLNINTLFLGTLKCQICKFNLARRESHYRKKPPRGTAHRLKTIRNFFSQANQLCLTGNNYFLKSCSVFSWKGMKDIIKAFFMVYVRSVFGMATKIWQPDKNVKIL